MPNSKYTYDDFTKAASSSGLLSDFDTDDLHNARINPDAAMTLLSYKKDYVNAMRNGNDSAAYLAQDGIDRIRAGYAPQSSTPTSAVPQTQSSPYSMKDALKVAKSSAGHDVGDVSGLDANSDGNVDMKDSVYMARRIVGYDDPAAKEMAKDDAAVKPADYNTEYSRALGEYLSGDVNVEGSDLWKNLSKTYAREGARAQESVLDQYAAANGGQLSSYAQSAAAQQRNYYMSQLMDRYPEIYSQLRGEQADRLSALMSAMELQRSDAVTAAQYGDYTALQELGIDPTRYIEEEEYKKRAQEALYAAQYGDYTLLDTLFGSDVQSAQNSQKQLENALYAAELGDYSLLDSILGTSTGEKQASDEQLQRALYAAELGDYSLLDSLLGTNTSGAQERAERIAALQTALGYGDASGFDSLFSTSVGDVLSEEKAYERSQTELERAYTLAQLGMFDELASLTGRTVDEVKSAISSVSTTSGTSGSSGSSSSGSTSLDKGIPSSIKTVAKSLAGNNYELVSKLGELVSDGVITEEQGDYLYSLYGVRYTTRDQAIEAGADEIDTWSKMAFDRAKTEFADRYTYLPDTYEEYLEYMVAKGQSNK